MQVKKYEAPTLQEALDTIKRELGPEAIILQTKQNRRGFGLMSKGSVEVTAALSERANEKKKAVEKKMPEAYTQKINSLPAKKQADLYETYLQKRLERDSEKDRVQLSRNSKSVSNSSAAVQEATKRITAVRYADIADNENQQPQERAPVNFVSDEPAIPEYSVPSQVAEAVDSYQNAQQDRVVELQQEVAQLKKLVEELRRERKRPEYIDSDSPLSATEALQETYEMLLQSGIDRRLANQIMREVARELNVESRADRDQVLDAVAERLLSRSNVKNIFQNIHNSASAEIHAFVGPSGAGKTASLAKVATDGVRNRNEKIGIIRIQILGDEVVDPLVVFSKALHIPYRAVTSVDELQVAIQDMSGCHRIFIDTPGISSRDPETFQQLKSFLQAVPQIRVQAVLSVTTREHEISEQSKLIQSLNPQSLVFTRLDESYSPGVVLSISNRMRIPVSVFSRGKKVTQDWETATPERIAASILNLN